MQGRYLIQHRAPVCALDGRSASRCPAVLRARPAFAMDQFSDLRRADEPLDEEKWALQLVLGSLGVFIGPIIFGSALIGLAIGLAGASALINAGGTTGLWAREIGWQVSQLFDKVRTRKLVSDARVQAIQYWGLARTKLSDIASQSQVVELRTQFASLVRTWWSKVLGWATACGLRASLEKLWGASRIGEWLAYCNENVAKRRREGGLP